jgi:predicted ATPase
VAAVSGAADVADAVASLVAKSLVNPDPQEPADRWRLLETIRAFALEKLAASGETESAARRHAGFYHDLLVRLAPALVLEPTTEGFRRCCRELENIRSALDWSFGPGANASLGTVLVAEYSPVWLHLSLIGECLERTEQALACLPADIDARLQMQLQIGLAYALIHTGGSAARTKILLAMALETAIPLDDIVAQNYVFWASWICDANSGDFRAAARSAGRFSRLANRSRSPARRLVADRLLGATMHYRGDQRRARKYLKGILDRDRLVDGQPYAIWFQYDIDVMARATLARVLCLEGFPDRAGENVAASLDGARAADHRLMLCHVLSEAACPVALITGDLSAAERLVEELIGLATSHDAAYWKILGRCLEGQIHIARGAFTSGVALLRAALAGCDQSGWTIRYPEFLGALATGLAGMEHYGEALACLDRAMQLADATGERWYMAELLRSKGELLRRDGEAGSIEAAETCFIGAIEVAQWQGALLWELRAGLALARLREAAGRPEEAWQIVTPISSRFTEGFESAELRAAAAMASR